MVNKNLQCSKLQQMKSEISLLREELEAAKMEAGRLGSLRNDGRSVTSSASVEKALETWNEGEKREDEEMGGAGGSDLTELQHRLNHASATLDVYSKCFKTVRDILGGMLSTSQQPRAAITAERQEEEEEEVVDGTEKVWLHRCLKLLEACETQEAGSTLELDSDTVSSSKAISSLRSELEECRKKLCTHEQVLAEKMEEMSELRSACQLLLKEKERAEAMWLASQSNEAQLMDHLQELEKKVAMFEEDDKNDAETVLGANTRRLGVVTGGRGVILNGVGVANRENFGEDVGVVDERFGSGGVGFHGSGKNEEGEGVGDGTLSEDSLEEEEEEEEEEKGGGDRGGVSGGDGGYSSEDLRKMELQKFEATRSLLFGKVETSRLEVRVQCEFYCFGD